jgi:hypothetical protein
LNPNARIIIVLLVVGAVAGGGFLWLRHSAEAPAPASTGTPVTGPRPEVTPTLPATPPPPAAPAIRHPIGPARGGALEGAGALPPLDASDGAFGAALSTLLGHKSIARFLALDDFARHFVATVDNLATDNAAADLWPVRPTPGVFQARTSASGETTIAADNGGRYTPFVRWAQGIDTARALALYAHFYPLLQRAYEEVGYPGKYFNDRVVEVIDHLLATPERPGPIAVKRVALEGAVPGSASRPLYVYADPAAEAGTAGQKILWRMGRENAGALKAKLSEIRQGLVGQRLPDPAPTAVVPIAR